MQKASFQNKIKSYLRANETLQLYTNTKSTKIHLKRNFMIYTNIQVWSHLSAKKLKLLQCAHKR